MKRVYKIICSIVLGCFTLISLAGCGEKVVYPSQSKLNLFISNHAEVTDLFIDDALSIYYKASSNDVKELLDVYIGNIQILNIEENESDLVYYLSVADVEKLTNDFLSTEGFNNDYKKMINAGKELSDVRDYVALSIASLIKQGSDERKEVLLKCSKSDTTFNSNVEIVNVVKSAMMLLNELTLEDEKLKEEDVNFDLMSFSTTKNAFVYSDGTARILIDNLELIYNEEAISELKKLSPVNNVSCNDKLVLIKFSAKNLSNKDTVVRSLFKGITADGRLLKNNFGLVGLLDESPLAAKKKVNMSAVVVMGEDDYLCWYSSDISGNVRIIE